MRPGNRNRPREAAAARRLGTRGGRPGHRCAITAANTPGVSLDIPIFNRRAARNDISKAQLAVRSQQLAVTQTVQAKYEFVFRRRFPISTAGSRCNSENGRF